MTTFVLVHGTGAGGWCRQKVAWALRAAGSEGYAPTLSGVDLATHIANIANLLFYEDIADAVLVGHRYAGMVVTGVASAVPEQLRLLVYLDACVPDAGQCEFDLWTPEMRPGFRAAREDGGMWPPPPPVGIADPALVAWYSARVTPHPPPCASPSRCRPGTPASEAVPRAHIRCTEGPLASLFGPFAEKTRRRGWRVRTLAAGHEAERVAPLELAALLVELASPCD